MEKVFDFLDHDFLFSVLEKLGFGKNLIYWIKILINNHVLQMGNIQLHILI